MIELTIAKVFLRVSRFATVEEMIHFTKLFAVLSPNALMPKLRRNIDLHVQMGVIPKRSVIQDHTLPETTLLIEKRLRILPEGDHLFASQIG